MAANISWTYTICLILGINMAAGHIPMSYSYKSAEPDSPIYCNHSYKQLYDVRRTVPKYYNERSSTACVKASETFTDRLSRDTSLSRLTAMRTVLAEAQVDAYIVPTADAHNSQYIAPADARREWLSGLRGSSGTAVVTANRALVWTDARYWTQFDVEVDSSLWDLMRQGTDLSIQDWLAQNMQAGSVVAVDPTTYTRTSWTALQTALDAVNVRLVALYDNLVDEARRRVNDGPPARPNNALLALNQTFTGHPSSNKRTLQMSQIIEAGASALLLTALDDIAYTLNIRGSDIPYNPVFFAYLLIRTDIIADNMILFWGDGNLSAEIEAHLASEGTTVVCRPYEEIFNYLRSYSIELTSQCSIMLSGDASHAVYLAIEQGPARINVVTVTPVALMKTVKNLVELEGFRSAHIKDGVAVVRSLHWVEKQVAAGVQVTEIDLSDQMEKFRGEEEYFMGPSFATIAGAGANGAIIHYKPERDGPQKVIEPNDMLLVDSGGQYFDGTTDITRTRHMSASPTPAQRLAFTRVLKGQINLGTTVMPRGTLGHVVEVLARKSLWDVGLNYGHGTGHGVGHFLNVHEGPAWILSGPSAGDPGISPGMIYSNEPGYYEVGEYGIRHEDLVEIIEMSSSADHPYALGLVGNFEDRGAVGFYTISLAPHQTACLDVDLMTDFEIKFLNDYHARVLNTLGPILQARGLTEDYAWLEKECAPIARGAAILFKSTPILAAISVVVVWLGM